MMEEYAIRVFFLIEQATKIEAAGRLDDIAVTSIPYMEQDAAQSVIRGYETRAKDEIIDMDRDEHAGEKLKKIFG